MPESPCVLARINLDLSSYTLIMMEQYSISVQSVERHNISVLWLLPS